MLDLVSADAGDIGANSVIFLSFFPSFPQGGPFAAEVQPWHEAVV